MTDETQLTAYLSPVDGDLVRLNELISDGSEMTIAHYAGKANIKIKCPDGSLPFSLDYAIPLETPTDRMDSRVLRHVHDFATILYQEGPLPAESIEGFCQIVGERVYGFIPAKDERERKFDITALDKAVLLRTRMDVNLQTYLQHGDMPRDGNTQEIGEAFEEAEVEDLSLEDRFMQQEPNLFSFDELFHGTMSQSLSKAYLALSERCLQTGFEVESAQELFRVIMLGSGAVIDAGQRGREWRVREFAAGLKYTTVLINHLVDAQVEGAYDTISLLFTTFAEAYRNNNAQESHPTPINKIQAFCKGLDNLWDAVKRRHTQEGISAEQIYEALPDDASTMHSGRLIGIIRGSGTKQTEVQGQPQPGPQLFEKLEVPEA